MVEPDDVRAAVTVHHRAPAGSAWVGFFCEVRRWSGTPDVREPKVCDAMDWFAFDALPEPMVAYCRAGLDAYRAGVPVAVHFQESGDPIGHDPAVDRLRIVPAPGCGEPRHGREVREFTHRTLPCAAVSVRDLGQGLVDTVEVPHAPEGEATDTQCDPLITHLPHAGRRPSARSDTPKRP